MKLFVSYRERQLRRRSARDADTLSSPEDSSGYMYAAGTGDHQSWTVHLPDGNDKSREGFLNLNEIRKSSKRGKPSLRLNSFFHKSAGTTLSNTGL